MKLPLKLRDHKYHAVITAMQDRVFYTEDEDGVLRRWYPPRPLEIEDDSKEQS